MTKQGQEQLLCIVCQDYRDYLEIGDEKLGLPLTNDGYRKHLKEMHGVEL